MIGQQQLSNRIQQLIENDAFPRFSIFVGPKGSGKKTLLLEMFEGIFTILQVSKKLFLSNKAPSGSKSTCLGENF